MKKHKIELKTDCGVYPVEVAVVTHRGGSETFHCWVKFSNGKRDKLSVSLIPLNPPDSNGNEWRIDGCAMHTHAKSTERLSTAAYFVRSTIEFFETLIEADKYVEVKVRIPKGEYCEECPLFDNGAGYEYNLHCKYLDVALLFGGEYTTKKHEDCPAGESSVKRG